jgi:SagB-type dehydrogenase family enzyme
MEPIHLAEPSLKGEVSVEEAIKKRRTVRSFSRQPLNLFNLSQLLWAAQGITGEKVKFRSTPSAGIIYPLDVYVVVGHNAVEGLEEGIYRYVPDTHSLERVGGGERRDQVAQAAFRQEWMTQAPALIVITAEFERLTQRYGERAVRYAELEAGHAGQNIFLQAEAEGLGVGIVGVSDADELSRILSLPPGEEALIILPVGHRANADMVMAHQEQNAREEHAFTSGRNSRGVV